MKQRAEFKRTDHSGINLLDSVIYLLLSHKGNRRKGQNPHFQETCHQICTFLTENEQSKAESM